MSLNVVETGRDGAANINPGQAKSDDDWGSALSNNCEEDWGVDSSTPAANNDSSHPNGDEGFGEEEEDEPPLDLEMTAASEEATMDLGTVILASEKKIAAREDSEGEVEAVLQAEVVVLVEKMVDLEAVILASEEEIAAQEDSEEEVAAALQAEMVASEVATADLEAVILASEEEMAVREDSEEEVAAALQAEMVVSEMATVVLEAEDHPASEEEASTLRVPYSEAIAASQTPNLSEEEASVEEVEDHSVREAVVLEMRTVRSTAEMKKVPDEVEASEDEELQEVVVVLTLVSEAPKVDSEALRGAVDSVTTDLTRSPTLTTTLAILVQAKIEDLDQSGMMGGFGGGGDSGFGGGGSFGQQSGRFGDGDGFGGGNDGFGHRGDGDRRDNACYNCGATDHISRECPNPPKSRRIEGESEVPKKPPSTFIPKDEDVEVLFKDHIEQGEMFTKLFEAQVTLTEGGLHGRSEKCKKITSFEELELTEQLAENVVNAGYKHPTPIQQYAMPAIFNGRDIMACAQTGSGKTAAFLLPVMSALMRSENLSTPADRTCCPRCLIIAPTRELAVQIYNEARKFAFGTVLHVACCYGGTSVMAQRQTLSRGATILVATVGRLKHFISEGYISLREIKYLILDEADRMLEMGFEDTMNYILKHESLSAREDRQTFMFSATFPAEEIIECTSKADKKERFLELLNFDMKRYEVAKEADVFKKKTLVFVTRKVFADTLGVMLSEFGIPSVTIHGDRYQNQREETIREFKQGKKPVMIATAVAERGLDIKGVDHVINYDLPTNGQDYVHRIGRTGRVGNPGRATSLYLSDENRDLAQSLVEILTEAEQAVPEFLANDANCTTSRFGGFGSAAAHSGGIAAQDEEEEWC
ncbi:unnamed protein product [Heligmosomoides polygyrus]|uniref:RNA helicase n=1 Tax=Heligmosomoides polygyrus TaxID=6339 RepID=A0A183G7E8_HELPZ|nr:unnamed protein product [Heligmosomoides polygyrus]